MTRPQPPHPADKQSAKQSHLLFVISDCGRERMLLVLCAHNKVELNYQLGRACSNCYCEHSVAGTFVIVIEAPADIIGVRDNEKEVELTRAEYQRVVASGIMCISEALTLAQLRSLLLTCLTGYGIIGVTRHTSCQWSPP